MKTVPLSSLKPGAYGKVVKIELEGNLRRRVQEMGLVPGVELEVKGKAPLGDPLEIALRGYRLSLRKEEANGILVETGG